MWFSTYKPGQMALAFLDMCLWMTQIHRSSWDGTTALSQESQF